MALAPYQRIVDDVKRQLRTGALQPGDRLPSTRELARRWKVALATAAHALRTLAQEGVVKTVPRVGTVVAGGPSRTGATRASADLTRERIVRAAIAVADDEGLPALSIRGVAAKLELPVMSLYRHVASKDVLLFMMAELAFAEEPLPAKPPPGWRAQLELAARLEWRVFKRHPWLARVVNLTRPQPQENALAFADWVMRALTEARLPPQEAMRVHVLLHAFVQGIAVNLESEADAVAQSGMNDEEFMQRNLSRFLRVATSGRFPHFERVLSGLRPGFDLDFDELFEMGLRVWLDGLEARLAKRAR
ncbi:MULTISPECIES: TetR/AcrR family transcriptional regulator C-terminal domain-containing protein [unclassified Corallococcus]|uniref:TetR/AcrR family transcriptional regulator C-terminal domain-containing protein n=1 Tax=unclassified Corallococcus TaxID=2685029 RepID=UPI001A8F597C|nr:MULTISPECIES: TetR/AcrR family transcriptional regulator C-terminal domain-containing protein [unclassified Corallococcus]MBN9688489.1 TetR/AcrR family transcriptional regulator C-terminal domain-containing protein [Corallococcus sp. NCSPR001]WAS87709.1 TetR/AcrR family transcriptional regulator C-terminal domain-containing protein [Corallococcus sp. NCRR]